MNFFDIANGDLQMPDFDGDETETAELCEHCDEPLEARMIDLDGTNLEERKVCVNQACESNDEPDEPEWSADTVGDNLGEVITVKEMNDESDFEFIVQDEEVENVKAMYPQAAAYDSFFAYGYDGEYQVLYGMHGTFPGFDVPLYKISI